MGFNPDTHQYDLDDDTALVEVVGSHDATLGQHTAQIATKLPGTPSPAGTPRSLNAAFQISNQWPALAFYTLELSVTAPLLSSQSISVQLLHDQNNPPTTVDGEAKLSSGQLAGLGLVSIATTQRQVLVAWIAPGDYVELVTSGGGTATLINQTELVFSA